MTDHEDCKHLKCEPTFLPQLDISHNTSRQSVSSDVNSFSVKISQEKSKSESSSTQKSHKDYKYFQSARFGNKEQTTMQFVDEQLSDQSEKKQPKKKISKNYDKAKTYKTIQSNQ